MSNFLIFKAAFNNSATPAIGTYTAEGATALFNLNASISPDYYLYNTADGTAVQWFVPTTEATDFEFVADILTRQWTNPVTYFVIADNTGTTRLRMWSRSDNWYFENSDSTATAGDSEYIGVIDPTTSGGFGVFHRFRVRVRKLTASSSSVEVYVDGTLKLTATAGAALVTCAKIGFVGGVNTFGPGIGTGIKNAYVYDLSSGDVIGRGVLSEAFNRFINWAKGKYALKSDIPTVNNATLTIQQNGTNVQTFTANQATAATANIQCVDLSTAQTIAGDKDFTGTLKFTSSPGIAQNTNPFLLITTNNYDKGTAPASDMGAGVRFFCNPDAAVTNKITGGLDVLYYASGYNVTGLNARNYDENDTHRNYSVSLRVSNNSTVPIDFVPSVNAAIDLGSSTAQWNNAYIKALTINGTAAGDILTHNASEFVPVSGGAVMTGGNLGRIDNGGNLDLCGGTDYSGGATIALRAKDSSVPGEKGHMHLHVEDLSGARTMRLQPSGTWVWDGSAVQLVSDQRLKQQITEIDDALLDAWEDVELSQFKYNDAVDQKGNKARLHTGYVVQQIDKACKEHGVDISAYGLYCHEEYPEETEEVEIEQADGTKVKETKVIREASEHYSLRYTEALVVECKYLRRCMERLTARIEQLEKGKEQEASK